MSVDSCGGKDGSFTFKHFNFISGEKKKAGHAIIEESFLSYILILFWKHSFL